MTDIYSLSLADITPGNIAQDNNISALISAIDPQLAEIFALTDTPLLWSRIDSLPENLLDLLAWHLHTDFYDLAETPDRKRKLIKSSVIWHMHKGTEWAIREALSQLDIDADFIPWWKSGQDPYTFKIDARIRGDFYLTRSLDRIQSTIIRVVEDTKAARSYMSDLQVCLEFDNNLYIAPILIENRDIELGVDLQEMQELLQLFEDRILKRIDAYEKNLTLIINKQQKDINLQLEEIKDLLRWKGADEPLA